MSELIDRQEAIDALARTAREKFNLSDEYNHYLAGLMDGELAIKERPTIQPVVLACGNGELVATPEPQWIPCRNDLPDIGMTVLFCDIDGDEFIGHRALDYWWSVDEKVKSVIAWMPLPEAYKPNK
jgi:hypothetical protein